MHPTFRKFGLPIAAGSVCHVGLFFLIWHITLRLFPDGAEEVPNHWFYELSPWVNAVHALLPGFLAGFLASRRPMLCGAIAVFLGSIFTSAMVGSWWLPPYSVFAFSWPIQGAAIDSIFGLAGAAAGYLTRSMNTNFSSKPTADAAA